MPVQNDVYEFPDYMLDENGQPQLWTWGGKTQAHIAASIAKYGLDETITRIENEEIILLEGSLEEWKIEAHQIFQRVGNDGIEGSNGGGSRNKIGKHNDVILGVIGE